MTRDLQTAIIVHLAAEWRTFHRRAMLLALAEELPPGASMLCINRPISFDVAPWKHPRKFWSGIWRTDFSREESRIAVVTPRLLLHEMVAGRIAGASAINGYLMRIQIRNALQRCFPGAERLFQWIYHPVQHWVWDLFPQAGKIYECYDDYSRSAEGDLIEANWQAEVRLLREADISFVTAQSLWDARFPVARRLRHLPNGVPEFFFQVKSGDTCDPVDLVPHPRICYLGNIFSHLDFRLMEDVFRQRPQWQFVLVGPVEKGAPIGRLRSMPNVHFMGPRTFDRVPEVLEQMDAGVIPFVTNDFTRAINPLKLYEYLATGLPVVATRLPELERFPGLVRPVNNDTADFVRAIDEILVSDRSSMRLQCVQAARPYSWNRIIRESVLPVLSETFGF